MKLRHLILLTSAIGACGALLLAADLYRRLKEAEAANSIGGAALREDSVLAFGMYHTMGLLSLAFIFLSLFLMLLTSVRDRKFVAAIETPDAAPLSQEPAPPAAPVPSPVSSAAEIPPALTSAPETAPVALAPEAVVPPNPAPVEVVPGDAEPQPVSTPPPVTIVPDTNISPAEPAVPPPAPESPLPNPEKRVLAFETPLPESGLPSPSVPLSEVPDSPPR